MAWEPHTPFPSPESRELAFEIFHVPQFRQAVCGSQHVQNKLHVLVTGASMGARPAGGVLGPAAGRLCCVDRARWNVTVVPLTLRCCQSPATCTVSLMSQHCREVASALFPSSHGWGNRLYLKVGVRCADFQLSGISHYVGPHYPALHIQVLEVCFLLVVGFQLLQQSFFRRAREGVGSEG